MVAFKSLGHKPGKA